ncbi:tripartite motif-containing protein 16-like [Sardina pilchardus]|uniref:tripartite motif-containing protein 16-like n=1 Tax=Sardina pilchardus TaxID=27697 RepID=UPI002E103478
MDEHKDHEILSIAAQRAAKQKELQNTQQSSQQKIQAKEKNLTALKQAMESLTNSEQVVMEDTETVFAELVRMVKERCSEVKEVIRTQKEAELGQARTLSDQLHQEIEELRRKDLELEQLSQIEDHLDFLQTSLSSSVPSGLEDVPETGINPQASFEKVQPCLAELRKNMEGVLTKELKNISDIIKRDHIVPKEVPTTREDLLRYASHFLLDSNTIQGQICLTSLGRAISSTFPQSFGFTFGQHQGTLLNQGYQNYGHVLSAQRLSGRSYWEAEWSESDAEVIVAVTYTGSGRLGEDLMSWALLCSHAGYSFQHNNVKTQLTNVPVVMSLFGEKRITKVGIYLDFDAGILAFYTLSDRISLLHKVQTSFTQAVCPAFAVRGTGSGTCTLSSPSIGSFGI